MSNSKLFSFDWMKALNDKAAQISPELLLFLENASDYFDLLSQDAKFFQGVQSLYAIYKDSGWICRQFGYVYSGKKRLNPNVYAQFIAAVKTADLEANFRTVSDLRTIIGHTAAAAQPNQTAACEMWFQRILSVPLQKPSKEEHYRLLVDELEKMAVTVEQVCDAFLEQIKKLSETALQDVITRWREVFINQYSLKQDYIIQGVMDYLYWKNSVTRQIIKRNQAEHILLSYYYYDIIQLKGSPAYSCNPEYQRKVDDIFNNRVETIVNNLPSKEQAMATDFIDGRISIEGISSDLYHDLLDDFFRYELPLLIEETLDNDSKCSLHPNDLCMFILENTTTDVPLLNRKINRFKY